MPRKDFFENDIARQLDFFRGDVRGDNETAVQENQESPGWWRAMSWLLKIYDKGLEILSLSCKVLFPPCETDYNSSKNSASNGGTASGTNSVRAPTPADIGSSHGRHLRSNPTH